MEEHPMRILLALVLSLGAIGAVSALEIKQEYWPPISMARTSDNVNHCAGALKAHTASILEAGEQP
jgi:hypothetical protein